MCLSRVHFVGEPVENAFMSKVVLVELNQESGEYEFTNVVGSKRSLKGKIVRLDLVQNVIDFEVS